MRDMVNEAGRVWVWEAVEGELNEKDSETVLIEARRGKQRKAE